MDTQVRFLGGSIAGLMALFAPVQPLILCAVAFVLIDLFVGLLAHFKRAKRLGRKGQYNCKRAWDTINKLVFMMVGIVLSWSIDTFILVDIVTLNLAKIFTGFACGFEFLSILRNMSYISQHPVFRFFSKFLTSKLSEQGIDLKKEKRAK